MGFKKSSHRLGTYIYVPICLYGKNLIIIEKKRSVVKICNVVSSDIASSMGNGFVNFGNIVLELFHIKLFLSERVHILDTHQTDRQIDKILDKVHTLGHGYLHIPCRTTQGVINAIIIQPYIII